jgi:hypothetical protein
MMGGVCLKHVIIIHLARGSRLDPTDNVKQIANAVLPCETGRGFAAFFSELLEPFLGAYNLSESQMH